MAWTQDTLLASFPGQEFDYYKVAAPPVLAPGFWASFWHSLGNPGAANNPAVPLVNGELLTDATVGAIPLTDPAGGSELRLAAADCVASQPGVALLYDRLWHGSYSGTTALGTNVAVAPPALTRWATGKGNTLWIEGGTINMSATATNVVVTYTNQDGVAGRVTPATSINALPIGRMIPLPLQAGDTGVRAVTNVVHSGVVGSAGNYRVVLLRAITQLRLPQGNVGQVYDAFELGFPIIDPAACLAVAWLASIATWPNLQMGLSVVSGVP